MTTAFVLAGGFKPELGQEQSTYVEDALIRIGNRYMVEYVVNAVQNSTYVQELIVVGPLSELKEIYQQSSAVKIIKNGKTTIESFLQAFQVASAEQREILVVMGDLPLLTTAAVNHFCQICRGLEGDFFYPIIRREVSESKYPGARRTYVHLKEGVFTGGNLLYIKSDIVKKCVQEAEQLVRLRKKPLSLAALLGWKFLLAYLLRRLSIQDAEKEVSRLLGGVKGVGVISPYPEIGIDVDKPSDLALVQQILCS